MIKVKEYFDKPKNVKRCPCIIVFASSFHSSKDRINENSRSVEFTFEDDTTVNVFITQWSPTNASSKEVTDNQFRGLIYDSNINRLVSVFGHETDQSFTIKL